MILGETIVAIMMMMMKMIYFCSIFYDAVSHVCSIDSGLVKDE
jgi:hypothetical protein